MWVWLQQWHATSVGMGDVCPCASCGGRGWHGHGHGSFEGAGVIVGVAHALDVAALLLLYCLVVNDALPLGTFIIFGNKLVFFFKFNTFNPICQQDPPETS